MIRAAHGVLIAGGIALAIAVPVMWQGAHRPVPPVKAVETLRQDVAEQRQDHQQEEAVKQDAWGQPLPQRPDSDMNPATGNP